MYNEAKEQIHEQFMAEALKQARLALAEGEFPVGCVLVLDKVIIAHGHRQNSEGAGSNEIDHAEVVTLRRMLADQPGVDCTRITAYSTMEPCLMCYSTMLLSGIRRFVWGYEDIMGGGTSMPLARLTPRYREMEVELVSSVLRRQSLLLFGEFFRQYTYWQDSLLADYTLQQVDELEE